MSYAEALAWLYAMQRHGIKLGLENIQRLLRRLECSATLNAKVIHVAGTNGKGSVCAMADSIARAAGCRSGLFTSPHLISFRERIRVDGECISESKTAAGLTRIRQLIEQWESPPTFFEIATALAVDHFQRQSCAAVVLETGMGGRLDATNAIEASASVLTPIDFDHQKWLGNSIAEIAAEKAGIIKPRVPVVSSAQHPEAEAVIRRRAAECEAPLRFVTTALTKVKPSLRGAHQQLNAALAVASIKAANLEVSAKNIEHGLTSVQWPARFQVLDRVDLPSRADLAFAEHDESVAAPTIVIDGAHNPAGAKALVETWREQFAEERATIVLAVLGDKDALKILQALRPIAARFFLPQIRSQRAMSPLDLSRAVAAIDPTLPHLTFASTGDAISAAQNLSQRILITGSLHFAGEALAILRDKPEALEECWQ